MPTLSESSSASDDIETPPQLIRPALGPMIKYWYGGTLPPRHNSWVLHDVTCRTWVIRHFARWLLLVIAPFFTLYMLVIPGSLPLRLYTGITFASTLLLVSMLYILIETERRAVQAGYRPSEPTRVRAKRTQEKHSLAVAARRAKMEQRRAHRSG